MIRKMSVVEMEAQPNLAELFDAYSAESSTNGMPAYNAQIDVYRGLEAAGVLHIFGAINDGKLVGFICLLVTIVPHYARTIATTESYFVAPEHRSSGAGIKLLRTAEAFAESIGAAGMFVSAPINGKLAQVMDAMDDYRETNRVYFRSFGHV